MKVVRVKPDGVPVFATQRSRFAIGHNAGQGLAPQLRLEWLGQQGLGEIQEPDHSEA
jgi:hypothetical protein